MDIAYYNFKSSLHRSRVECCEAVFEAGTQKRVGGWGTLLPAGFVTLSLCCSGHHASQAVGSESRLNWTGNISR